MIRILISPSASMPPHARDIGHLSRPRSPWFLTTGNGLRCCYASPEALRYALRNEWNEPRAEVLVEALIQRVEAGS